jgi:hypothetical protein
MDEDQGQLLALLPEGRLILHHPSLSAGEKGERLLTLLETLDRAIAHEHAREAYEWAAAFVGLRRWVERACQEFRA